MDFHDSEIAFTFSFEFDVKTWTMFWWCWNEPLRKIFRSSL